jgi:hypothetical protein
MEMVDLNEQDLNHLFDVLQDWNYVLQGTSIASDGPPTPSLEPPEL